jgi:hypothetical protein
VTIGRQHLPASNSTPTRSRSMSIPEVGTLFTPIRSGLITIRWSGDASLRSIALPKGGSNDDD